MAKEKAFTIGGVQGELKLVYGPFKMRLYQDGREIKRQGTFKPKYYVTNTAGEQEEMMLQYGIDFVHVAIFRGQKIALEERLTTAEYIIGGLPVLLIFLGGVIGAVFGVFGATFNYDYMRQEKRMPMQLLVSIGVSVLCYISYFILAIALQLLVGK